MDDSEIPLHTFLCPWPAAQSLNCDPNVVRHCLPSISLVFTERKGVTDSQDMCVEREHTPATTASMVS